MTNLKKIFKIKNKCGMDLSQTEELFHSLGGFAQKRFGFKKPPTLNLVSDQDNASKPLGKTAYYDPQSMSVTIYTDNRHTKDILRSLAHELVHHTQNENGMLNDSGYHGTGYAQKNKDLRQSEKEAYLKGNMCFRDWEDGLKQSKPTIYNEWRINTMSTKKWKNNELMENLSKKFGFKMDLDMLKEGEEPPQLKKHRLEKAGKKEDSDEDEESEEESEEKDSEKESSKSGKMPMKDEPPGKDLNKDGKKGHGKVPAFLKEKEDKKEMKESKLRKIIRNLILSEMKDKKKIFEEKQYSQNVLRSYQAFLNMYKGQEISSEMEDMLKMLMSKYEKNLKGVEESLYNIENNLGKFEKEAFMKAIDDLAEEISSKEFGKLAGFLGQTSTQPIRGMFPDENYKTPLITNRDVSNVAEAFVMALKRISSISKAEKE